MLFNSLAFIFLFLPLTFVLFFALARVNHKLAAGWLAAASLFFYGWWNPVYVALLMASIVFNYVMGMRIASAPGKKPVLLFAIVANLALLGYYKYSNFFLANAGALIGQNLGVAEIVLPLGISFFTFTQIAFLVDTYQGKVKEYNFTHYCLFVTYFPHLIAGPILHHAEMMPQFAHADTYRMRAENVAVGLTIFFIGLFKKVILADGIAPYVAPLYGLPGAGVAPTLLEAWCGVIAYSLQLYFDFSGYSDMAIGLSRMFGVKLPLNFHSPYKAVNIADLWNRWHMTLSRFLRDYVFLPLGGQRKSAWRRYSSVILTMFLCGLWHGAGWTYIVFGLWHGACLALNQAWRSWRGKARKHRTMPGTLVAVLLTYVCWLIGLVFFRADSVPHAMQMLAGMAGMNGVDLPDQWLAKWGGAGAWLAAQGVSFGNARELVSAGLINWIVILLAVVWFAPNTQQIMARFAPALLLPRDLSPARLMLWRPTVLAGVLVALIGLAAIANLHRQSEFLYFQF
jgi:D-alanyl-lipoteichoic acid acyltransferase DltB (MBOAT superfamily)